MVRKHHLPSTGRKEATMDWPTAAVLIAALIAVTAVLTTYIAARNPKK